jgi:plastocyanin
MVLTSRVAIAALVTTTLVAMLQVPAGTQGATGTVRGRFALPAATGHDHRPALIEPRVAPRPRQPRVGVVYLEVAPSEAFEPPVAARQRMDQRNETFVPHVLAIRTGTTVDFPNSDRIYHNVFSLSPTRKFDLGRYAVGRSKAVRFDRPGVVRVFCDIHSHMSAFILVFSHRYFAATQPDGTFQLPPVPAGTYMLAGWYEGEVRANRQVVVRSGETTVADLPVP